MCEANAYIRQGDKEELVFENVDKITSTEEGLLLEDIFGKRQIFRAKIKEMALVDHRIILEKL